MWIFTYLDQTLRGRGKQKDVILEITGPFGKYQFWLCFLLFLSKIPVAFNQLAVVFYLPPLQYTCGGGGGGGDARQASKKPCPCPNPIYDKSIFTNTMTMEFGLICEEKGKVPWVQAVFQAGTLVGSMGFGMASDRYGRRKPLVIACVFQFIFGMAGVYIYNYYLFIICRWLVGVTVGGAMVIAFVIIMEFIGPEYREVISALFQVPFNLGVTMLPLIAYYNRDWRDFQFYTSAPTIIFAIYYFTVPETPRWSIIHGRTEEAIQVLTSVAKMNGRPTSNIKANVLAFHIASSRNSIVKGSTADLFKTPNLRRNVLAMGWNWLACSYCYYGVSQYVGHLAGDIFVNVAATAALVAAGTVFSIILMKAFGRKTLLLICHATCSGCLIIVALTSGQTAVVFASFGTVTAFIVFVVVYLYASELFPTVVRNAAVGFSSMCARIGSMLAPFVIDLKEIEEWLPPLAFAVVPFVAFFVTWVMPETKGCDLLTTIEEAENFKPKPTKK